jgi:hypothetical protein
MNIKNSSEQFTISIQPKPKNYFHRKGRKGRREKLGYFAKTTDIRTLA